MSLVFGVIMFAICLISIAKNIANDAIDNALYEDKEKKRLQPIEYLRSKVRSPTRDTEVMKYIKSREHNERIYEEVSKDFEYIFGRDWRSDSRTRLLSHRSPGDIQRGGLHYEIDKYVHTLILAHEGILSGLTYSFDGASIPSVPVVDHDGKRYRRQIERLRLWKLVEKYINDYHRENLIDFYVMTGEAPHVCNRIEIREIYKNMKWEKLCDYDTRYDE